VLHLLIHYIVCLLYFIVFLLYLYCSLKNPFLGVCNKVLQVSYILSFKFFSLVCSSFLRNNLCRTTSVFLVASSGDLLLNKKQKKPLVSINNEVTKALQIATSCSNWYKFYIHIIKPISYCCFISAIDKDTERAGVEAGVELILSWHWFDMRSVNIFFASFSSSLENQNIFHKKNCAVNAAKTNHLCLHQNPPSIKKVPEKPKDSP